MILVVGATGSLGGRITRGLLAKGEDVRILVRHNSPSEELAKQGRANTAQSLLDAGAQPAWGDLKDRDSITAAVKGVDTVIVTATTTQRWGEDNLEAVDRKGMLDLIEEARRAGVGRFLYTSVQGAGPDHPLELFRIKDECERAIKSSGMSYTILKPSVFMEIWIGLMVGLPLMTGQTITLIGQGDHAHNLMSEADVAEYMIAMIDHPAALNQSIMVGGPGSYTWTQIVDRVGSRMGAELPRQYMTMGSVIPYLPGEANTLANAMETFEDFLDIEETAALYGVTPTTLDQYIDRTFVQ